MRDLKADLEICNRATPGPWEATSESDEDVRVCQTENEECVCCLALMGDYNWEKEEWKEGSKKQWNKDAEFIAAAREGWPYAIERAIKAEAENAKLRAVVEAAREFFEGTGCKPKECKKCDPKYINFCERSRIGQALTELDKEGER